MIYLGFDGVSSRVVEQTDLKIKDTHRMVTLTSNFPTHTNMAFFKIFDFEPLGYEPEVFFSRKDGKRIRTRALLQLYKKDRHHYNYYFDYTTNILFYGASYFFPRQAVYHEMRMLRKNNFGRFFSGVTDALGHRYGDKALGSFLKRVDDVIDRIDLDRHKLILFSDHGMTIDNRRNMQRLNLDGILWEYGFRTKNNFRRNPNERDVILDCAGLLNLVPIYCGTEKKKSLTEILKRVGEIELVLFKEGNYIRVYNNKGEATITRLGDMWKYRSEGCNLLGYKDIVMSDNESYLEFCDHRYPDALKRIWQAFELDNAADILAVLREGFYYGDIMLSEVYGRNFVCTHGSLSEECTNAFLLAPREMSLKTVKKRGREYMRIDDLRLD